MNTEMEVDYLEIEINSPKSKSAGKLKFKWARE